MRNIRLAANLFASIHTLVIELLSICPSDQNLVLYLDRRFPDSMRLAAGGYLLAFWTAGANPEHAVDAIPTVTAQIKKSLMRVTAWRQASRILLKPSGDFQ